MLEAIAFDFEALDDLPYGTIKQFCEKYANDGRVHLCNIAFTFCNDTFKLPLCLYYHPKIIAAVCIMLAMSFRRDHGCDPGVELKIHGHPWFKWIDSAIESKDIAEVYEKIRTIYKTDSATSGTSGTLAAGPQNP